MASLSTGDRVKYIGQPGGGIARGDKGRITKIKDREYTVRFDNGTTVELIFPVLEKI